MILQLLYIFLLMDQDDSVIRLDLTVDFPDNSLTTLVFVIHTHGME